MLTATTSESRSCPRRRVYLGEGIRFELSVRGAHVEAEAIDVSADGFGLAVTSGAAMFAIGEVVTVRGGGGEEQAVVRHIGRLRSGDRILPRVGLSFVGRDVFAGGFACPDELPAFAVAPSPFFFRE